MRSSVASAALVALVGMSMSSVPLTARPVEDRGARRFGLAVTEGEQTFEEAFPAALAAGIDHATLYLAWDVLETSPGVYDTFLPEVANLFYSAWGVGLNVVISPIDTNVVRVPDDLAGRAWDDPLVIARYRSLLDAVLPRLSDVDIHVLGIGNEVDATLATAADWDEWAVFFAQTAAHARSLRPGLQVGTVVTLPRLIATPPAGMVTAHGHADRILATYYPLAEDFTVQELEVIPTQLTALAAAWPDHPIVLTEIGLPSGGLNGSSEALQAEFIREVFTAWDVLDDRLVAVAIDWLTDIPRVQVDELLDYYGFHDPVFAEYLATLGLRRADGSEKPAMRALREEAALRGWPADAGAGATVCEQSEAVSCLGSERAFRVAVRWQTPDGTVGDGRRVAVESADSALLWFFRDTNWEMLVKVLDGCSLNGHAWVFAAGTTNVGWRLFVTDTRDGRIGAWRNLQGEPAPAVTDTAVFACP